MGTEAGHAAKQSKHTAGTYAPVVEAITVKLLLLAAHCSAELSGGRLGSAPTNCTQWGGRGCIGAGFSATAARGERTADNDTAATNMSCSK